MRFIGGFELLIIVGLCLCLLGPLMAGFALRLWRGVKAREQRIEKKR